MPVISTGLATIIGAVIAGGSAAIGAAMDSADAEEANRVGLQMANITRGDQLRKQKANEKMDMLGLRHQKNVFKFQKKEAAKDRAERESDRQYGKREKFKSDSLDFVNRNEQARTVFLNSVRRAA